MLPDFNKHQELFNCDYHESEKLNSLSSYCIFLAHQYIKAREEYGEAKAQLDLALAKYFNEDKLERSKMSKEKAMLFLIFDNEDFATLNKTMHHKEQEYKGLEKVIDTIHNKISLSQSLIKNESNLKV